MKKKNTKRNKLGIRENKDITYSSWCTGKDIETNIISRLLKQGYHMQKR